MWWWQNRWWGFSGTSVGSADLRRHWQLCAALQCLHTLITSQHIGAGNALTSHREDSISLIKHTYVDLIFTLHPFEHRPADSLPHGSAWSPQQPCVRRIRRLGESDVFILNHDASDCKWKHLHLFIYEFWKGCKCLWWWTCKAILSG